jgi:hypothetical protein
MAPLPPESPSLVASAPMTCSEESDPTRCSEDEVMMSYRAMLEALPARTTRSRAVQERTRCSEAVAATRSSEDEAMISSTAAPEEIVSSASPEPI